MKIITLSDHTAQQIQELEAARAAEQRAKEADYKERLRRFHDRRAQADEALKKAWADRRIWDSIKAFFVRLAVRREGAPYLSPMRQADDQENTFVAGNEGESRVLRVLAFSLDSNWIAFKGYRNGKGETDLVVVGPEGIAAIEVNYHYPQG